MSRIEVRYLIYLFNLLTLQEKEKLRVVIPFFKKKKNTTSILIKYRMHFYIYIKK